jgi:hypothetical protein
MNLNFLSISMIFSAAKQNPKKKGRHKEKASMTYKFQTLLFWSKNFPFYSTFLVVREASKAKTPNQRNTRIIQRNIIY